MWQVVRKWTRRGKAERPKLRTGASPRKPDKASPSFMSYLFVLAILLVLIYFLHMQLVLRHLKDHEKTTSDIYAKIYAYAASEIATDDDLSFIFQEVIERTTYPVIITTIEDSLVAWQGVGVQMEDSSPASRARLKALMAKMDKWNDPIPLRVPVDRLDRLTPDVKFIIDQMGGLFGYLHYGESYLINRLRWMPLLEMGAILLFITIGFLGFRNIKNSEQRYIWVGMAKETAHQLGTPLSSLFGWLELMRAEIEPMPTKERRESLRKFDRILRAMEQDVQRLTRMASRFSLIGSVPELKIRPVVPIVAEITSYMRERLPQFGGDVKIFEEYGEVPEVWVNRELLGWAFENLLKNALDALDHAKGGAQIRIRVWADDRKVGIEFKDTGRGVPPKDRKRVFRPGYSTKKLGWGLGLSFVKRIVEEYHGGKVFLRESIVGQGTVVEVDLPIPEGEGVVPV
ncbi:MAG: HAMP domain-containing sensor histidine kinase [Candidatus Latescibacterota bacterium]